MKGYVYILSNKSMPGLVKIGRTSRSAKSRASELYQTGVPTPFSVEWEVFSPDSILLEQSVHTDLSKHRVSASREFFSIEKYEAIRFLEMRHEEIVGMWLSEFMPDFTHVHVSLAPDTAHIHQLCDGLGASMDEVVSAMQCMSSDEIAPALARFRAARERRKVMRQSGAEVIRIV